MRIAIEICIWKFNLERKDRPLEITTHVSSAEFSQNIEQKIDNKMPLAFNRFQMEILNLYNIILFSELKRS